MGRVDDRIDTLGLKERREAFGAAEAADPLRDRRGGRLCGRAGERQERGDSWVAGETARERACFRRSSENEQAERLQRAAP
jgi:hypothetical protein